MAPGIPSDQYIGYRAIVPAIIFVLLAAAFVAARLLVRFAVIRNAGGDDWTILASFVSNVFFIAFGQYQILVPIV